MIEGIQLSVATALLLWKLSGPCDYSRIKTKLSIISNNNGENDEAVTL